MAPQVGDKVPSVPLYRTVDEKVNLAELCAGKRVVIVGIPGAYTPTCSTKHVPGYIRDYDAIRAKGVDLIVCVSINDPFVMQAWGKALNADGKVDMLADPSGAFTAALGSDMFLKPKEIFGPQPRSRRYSFFVVDGVFKIINIEPEGEAVCSLSDNLIQQLDKQ